MEKLSNGDFIGPEINPARDGQYRIIVYINEYPYAVPCVIDDAGNWF